MINSSLAERQTSSALLSEPPRRVLRTMVTGRRDGGGVLVTKMAAEERDYCQAGIQGRVAQCR